MNIKKFFMLYMMVLVMAGVLVTHKVNNSTKEMIIISDGWEYGKRYIDYQAFAYDLATSGFGSFNTIIVN